MILILRLSIVSILFFSVSNILCAQETWPEQLGARNKLGWIDHRRLNLYAGLSWVRSRTTEEEIRSRIERDLGGTLESFSVNQNRLGGHIGFGYEITDNIHLELMLYNFGEVNVSSTAVGFAPGSLKGPMSNHLPWTGYGPLFAVKFNTWVFNPYHRIFGRIGLMDWNSEYNIQNNISIPRSGQTPILSGGYEYFYKKGRSVRLQTTLGEIGKETLVALGAAYVIYFDGIPREPMPILRAEQKEDDNKIVYFSLDEVQRESNQNDDKELIAMGYFGLFPIGKEIPVAPKSTPIMLLGAFGAMFNFVVYFDFDKDEITSESDKTLVEIVRYLKRHDDINVLLTGHTDAVSDEKYNMGLSLRRIKSVKNYLKENQVNSEIIKDSKYFGKSYPSFKNNTFEGRRKNRRVHVCLSPSSLADSLDCRGEMNYSDIKEALLINKQEIIDNEINKNNNMLNPEVNSQTSENELAINCTRSVENRPIKIQKRLTDLGCEVIYQDKRIASAKDWNFCKRIGLRIINNLEDANYLCKNN